MNFYQKIITLIFNKLLKILLGVLKSIFRLYITDTKGFGTVAGQTVLLVKEPRTGKPRVFRAF